MAGVTVRVDTGFNDHISNDPLQELVAAVPSQRNWKGMAIAILVILSVIGLVALAVVIVTPPDPGPRLRGRRILLSDILAGKLKPRYHNGTWISGKILFNKGAFKNYVEKQGEGPGADEMSTLLNKSY